MNDLEKIIFDFTRDPDNYSALAENPEYLAKVITDAGYFKPVDDGDLIITLIQKDRGYGEVELNGKHYCQVWVEKSE